MESIQLLISDYLDRELVDDDIRRLGGLLRSDPAALDRFVLNSFVHSQLRDWMDPQRGQDQAIGLAQVGSAAVALHNDRNVRRSWRPSAAALAATLLIAASVATLAYMIASRPVVVGQLTRATGCRWQAPLPQLSAGTLLQSGQELNLVEGSALITFVNGAQLLMEGPTSLRLDSVSQVRLHNGQVAAKVPTQARGFAVTSSLARFVDLGTAFTLNLLTDTSFDLHVFEGLVELRLDEQFGAAAQRPLRVAQVRAVHFDVKSRDVAAMHFQEGKQMPF